VLLGRQRGTSETGILLTDTSCSFSLGPGSRQFGDTLRALVSVSHGCWLDHSNMEDALLLPVVEHVLTLVFWEQERKMYFILWMFFRCTWYILKVSWGWGQEISFSGMACLHTVKHCCLFLEYNLKTFYVLTTIINTCWLFLSFFLCLSFLPPSLL
jgi:hypothetical protein